MPAAKATLEELSERYVGWDYTKLVLIVVSYILTDVSGLGFCTTLGSTGLSGWKRDRLHGMAASRNAGNCITLFRSS